MSHYAAGANFERKVRDRLLADGAKLVIRSAGSRGPVDLVVLDGGTTLLQLHAISSKTSVVRLGRIGLVQVKRGGRLSKAKRAELVALAVSVGATAVLAYPEQVGRKIEVRLEVLS